MKKVFNLIYPMVISMVFCFNNTNAQSKQDEKPCFIHARQQMVIKDLKQRGIDDPVVLHAMGKVRRQLFVNRQLREKAYADRPLPIDEGQTISQPFIVALMTQCLELDKNDSVLEIGTGSGYQAAVLAEIAGHVYSVEIHKKLAEQAEKLLKDLGYKNISIKWGDGFFGWKQHAPYDAVILTCSVEKIPEELVKQLKDGGRLIMPLGNKFQTQHLVLGVKKNNRLEMKPLIPVRFVPMTGRAED